MVENRRTFLQVVGYICSPIDAYDRRFVLKFGLNYPCPISRLSMKMTQTQQDKDTVDINLTPQELQILSELDRYIALHKKKSVCFFSHRYFVSAVSMVSCNSTILNMLQRKF